MKDWLKFFGLSFFSDKIAKEARTRGVMNCVLGFVLALVFIFCGVLAANTVPFYTHYKNAPKFRSFASEAVEQTPLTVTDGIVSADKLIDTFSQEQAGDYNLVIDTRPSTALAVFEAYCVSKSDKSEISYEDYLALPDEDKSGYTFAIRYTPDELTLTDELTEKHESFLGSTDDEDTKKEYSALVEKKGELDPDEYRLETYKLYVAAYYPDITAFERAGDVPLVRSYYYRNYLNKSDLNKSLFIFSDVMFAFFETDGGLSTMFYGSYSGVNNGTLGASDVDDFMKAVFRSSTGTSATVYLMNTFKFIPFIAFIPLILGLIAKLVFVILKDEKYKKITTCLKVECSYLAGGALITALALFVFGFFVSNNLVNTLPIILYAIVLTVRTAVYLIAEAIAHKKLAAQEPPAEQPYGEEFGASEENNVENT